MQLELSIFGDEGYRWNEDVLADMNYAEQRAHLLESAQEAIDHNEWEVGYQILRELLWRDPCWRAAPWQLLSTCAIHLDREEEADVAHANYIKLKGASR